MDAYIYNDEGASPFCVNQATKTFRKAVYKKFKKTNL